MNPKPLLRTLCCLLLLPVSTAHALTLTPVTNPFSPTEGQSFDIFINGTTCRDASKDSIVYTPETKTYLIQLFIDKQEDCPPEHSVPRYVHSQIAEEASTSEFSSLYNIAFSGRNIFNIEQEIDSGSSVFAVLPPIDQQVYVPLNKPCRIVNTAGTQTPFNHETIQSYRAWGNTAQLNTQRAAVEDGVTLGACLPVPGMTPSSLVANVTVAAQAFKSSGNVVAYPSDSSPPTGSLVNFSSNNIANSTIIALHADAAIQNQHFDIKANILKNEAGGSKQANVVVDAIGYYYPKGNFTGLANRTDLTYIPLATPCRIVNTGGADLTFSDQTTRSFRAWGSLTELNVQRDTDASEVLGGCFPETGLTPSAIAANVTVAAQFFKSKGNIVAYPNGAAVPSSSLINFKANNIANSTIIGLSPLNPNNNHFTIKANIFNNNEGGSKRANVIVDAVGFFYANSETSGLNYIPLETPCRVVNTGPAGLTFNKTNRINQTFLGTGTVADLSGQRDNNNTAACLAEEGLTPAAMAANVTVAAKGSKARGNVVAYPGDGVLPNSSLVNFRSNNIANSTIIALDANQQFKVQANIIANDPGGSGQANVAVDVFGYFYQE